MLLKSFQGTFFTEHLHATSAEELDRNLKSALKNEVNISGYFKIHSRRPTKINEQI